MRSNGFCYFDLPYLFFSFPYVGLFADSAIVPFTLPSKNPRVHIHTERKGKKWEESFRHSATRSRTYNRARPSTLYHGKYFYFYFFLEKNLFSASASYLTTIRDWLHITNSNLLPLDGSGWTKTKPPSVCYTILFQSFFFYLVFYSFIANEEHSKVDWIETLPEMGTSRFSQAWK